MTDTVTYEQYLDLGTLLAAQHPRSDAPDELLFIVTHQTMELWLKLILAELDVARARIAADDLRPAFKMLSRVARAQTQMIEGWNVLATMTPIEFTAMRPHLGSSSGFQSFQYRMLEAVMGARNPRHLDTFTGAPDQRAALAAEHARPSIYDETLNLLRRRGYAIPDAPLCPDPSVEAVWSAVYRDAERHWDLYELAEKLVDLEYHVQRWRFGHLKTVERIIGLKRGTGGSAGTAYLAGVLKLIFFPELLSVRTAL
jgi:tryptophan 2,3-dioxygenase